MTSVRGAITVNGNTKDEIESAAHELLTAMLRANDLERHQVITVLFTATRDLYMAYPAAAARALGFTESGLICTQEMYVEGSLPRCLRVLMLAETGKTQAEMKHIYLRETVSLRPDLINTNAIAIDGPSGVGKSSLAKAIAREMGFCYVDTGAMYRAVALYCARGGVSQDDEKAVTGIIQAIDIDIRFENGEQHVYLNREDVTFLLRTPEVALGSSKVASISAVRAKLVEIQRGIGRRCDVVMDGRDICSKVLPWARVKIFLDASPHERALRRMEEYKNTGKQANYTDVLHDLETRDNRDANRDDSPLVRCADAVYINTDHMTLQEVKEKTLAIVRAAIG